MAPSDDGKTASTRSSQEAPSSTSVTSVSRQSSNNPELAPKTQNGVAAATNNASLVPHSETQPKQPDRPDFKSRLSRMFIKDAAKSQESANNGKKHGASGPNGHADANAVAVAPPNPPPIPRRRESTADKGEGSSKRPPMPRFVMEASLPGGHEHFLKSSRRQEKLGDLWRALIGKKAEQPGESDLSLVSSWVDTLKHDKDASSSADPKKAPTSATLVQKYGKCQEVVGRGAFGIVRISHKKMVDGTGEKLFAVKEFRRRPDEDEKRYSKRLTSEFCISSALRHPNVIHTLDLLKDEKGDFCEVMEFCAGGDLYTLVLSAGKLEVHEADCFFKQIMRGVEYLHEMGVAHRDLKPENLLLTTRGAIKITDFGNGECFRMAWEADAHLVSGLCGSAPYIAPEEYTETQFDPRAVDVWACGVIYMAMRTGRHLWRVARKNDDEFYEKYLIGRRDEAGYGPIEQLHRARCRNVIYSILDPTPKRRLSASQVLKSEWGREIKLCMAGEEGL